MSETNATSSPSSPQSSESSRRQFLQTAGATAAGAMLINSALSSAVYAQGNDTIKIGLIGCGGRGTGAAANALHAHPANKLVAMGDLFIDKITGTDKRPGSLPALISQEGNAQIDVPKDRQFAGWDAYKGVIEASDVVLLATTPHFRPLHIEACLNAGKHIFAEKPVGVDAKSVRKVMELSKAAAEKKINLVSGLCYRYDKYVKETVEQIHSGKIGDVVSINSNYLTGWLWNNPRQPQWSDMEYQIRNWLYYYWLSGDHVVEQHIHSLDKALWIMNNEPPTHVISTGGRQQRTAPEFGNIYDHFANVFEWIRPGQAPVRVFSYCRQFTGQPTVTVDVSDLIFGTEGVASLDQHRITDRHGKVTWKRSPTTPENMYDSEHKALFGAIRAGEVLNNGDYMCKSTLMGIMARESAYSGKKITWEEIMKSDQDLSPEGGYQWEKLPVAPVAVPGEYKFK
ncbi:MAG TPA: Gfo/Idh/MocA family oxidoreductase [Tepidisphaeraceae bacterium]|jgi:predicted dehydrogenase